MTKSRKLTNARFIELSNGLVSMCLDQAKRFEGTGKTSAMPDLMDLDHLINLKVNIGGKKASWMEGGLIRSDRDEIVRAAHFTLAHMKVAGIR